MNPPAPTGTVDGVDLDAVSAAVATCVGIASLGTGSVNGPVTYLPGRRLPGIRVNSRSVDVEIVAAWGPTAADIYSHIRVALLPLVGGRRIAVTIADIQLPDDAQPRAIAVPPLPLAASPTQPAPPAGIGDPASSPRLESDRT